MSTNPATIALSNAKTYTGLLADLSSDPLLNAVKMATAGGQSTADHFEKLNSMQQLYEKVGDQTAWLTGTDENTGLPVHYLEATVGEKAFFAQIGTQGIQKGPDGNAILRGPTTTINGNDYHGIGAIVFKCSWSEYPFSETSWDFSVAAFATAAGKLAWPLISPLLETALASIKKTLSEAFARLVARVLGAGGIELEGAVGTENRTAEKALVEEVGPKEIFVEEAAETSLACGAMFIGGACVLGIALVILSFVLHNTYHRVRIWNFTHYRLLWVIHFDNSQEMDQGKLVSGPVSYNADSSIKSYSSIEGIDNDPAPSGVQPPHTANFADLSINSSHEYSGIGYVLQFQLQDPKTNEIVYTGTGYFDMPFEGLNSEGVTFDAVPDLQKYYDDNAGGNTRTSARATSSDGAVTMYSTFDYLDGEHPVPNSSSQGGQYYYQSLLVFGEKGFFDIPK
ncbi:hypothetical protein BGZ88_007274 [Linnemannia elongata]|nr:hypothetical protein BGZ88_007274 [Linnemannia elongata]